MLARSWTVSGFSAGRPRITSCDIYLLGGPGVVVSTTGLFERTYDQLATHDIAYYSLVVVLFDNWQPSDSFTIKLDSNTPTTYYPNPSPSDYSSYSCSDGSSISNVRLQIVGKRFHSSDSITLKINFHISPSTSIAIRAIFFFFASHQPSDTNGEYLNVASTSSSSAITGCPTTKYMANSGICTKCNGQCPSCFGPSASQCYSAAATNYYDGNSVISNPIDNRCQLADPNDPSKCLRCTIGYPLGINNQCQNSCSGPYTEMKEGGYSACLIKCTSSQYRMIDNTCGTSCDPPLKIVSNAQEKACISPCGQSIEGILNYDGNCVTSCPYQTVIQNNYRFCLANTKDLSTTASILKITTNIAATLLVLINPRNMSPYLFLFLLDMIQYIRYLDIYYPPRLEALLDQNGIFDIISALMPSLDDLISTKFVNKPLPRKFEKYGLHSSFIANFWQPLCYLVLNGIIAILSCLLVLIQKPAFLHKVFRKLKANYKWNFCLAMLISYFGNIAFYSSLEFMTAGDFGPLLSIISLSICIFVNIIALIVLGKIICVLRAIRRSLNPGLATITTTTTEQSPAWSNISRTHHKGEFDDYEVIFEGLKSKSWMQQSYIVICIVRIYIFGILITYPFKCPLLQIIAITILSVVMIVYLLLKFPLIGKIDQGHNIIQEIILLIVNVCVVVLAYLDPTETELSDARVVLGDIVVWNNIASLVASSLYSILKLLIEIRDIYRSLRSQCRKRSIIQPVIRVNSNPPTLQTSNQSCLHEQSNIVNLLDISRDGGVAVVEDLTIQYKTQTISFQPNSGAMKPNSLKISSMSHIQGVINQSNKSSMIPVETELRGIGIMTKRISEKFPSSITSNTRNGAKSNYNEEDDRNEVRERELNGNPIFEYDKYDEAVGQKANQINRLKLSRAQDKKNSDISKSDKHEEIYKVQGKTGVQKEGLNYRRGYKHTESNTNGHLGGSNPSGKVTNQKEDWRSRVVPEYDISEFHKYMEQPKIQKVQTKTDVTETQATELSSNISLNNSSFIQKEKERPERLGYRSRLKEKEAEINWRDNIEGNYLVINARLREQEELFRRSHNRQSPINNDIQNTSLMNHSSNKYESPPMHEK